jgi:hypothetical protein
MGSVCTVADRGPMWGSNQSQKRPRGSLWPLLDPPVTVGEEASLLRLSASSIKPHRHLQFLLQLASMYVCLYVINVCICIYVCMYFMSVCMFCTSSRMSPPSAEYLRGALLAPTRCSSMPFEPNELPSATVFISLSRVAAD